MNSFFTDTILERGKNILNKTEFFLLIKKMIKHIQELF